MTNFKALIRAIWHAVETVLVSADLGHTVAGAGIFLTGFQANHTVHDALGVLAVVACGHIILRLAKRNAAQQTKTDKSQEDATEKGSAAQGKADDQPPV